jgi:hypothetical protein
MLISVFWAGFLLWRHGDSLRDRRESEVLLAGSGSVLLLTILLYDVFARRDFRLFGRVMLFCTLIFVDRKRVILVVLLIAGNLAVVPDFVAAHQQFFFKNRFSGDQLELAQFLQEISPMIRFDADKGAWGNTILLDQFIAENPLLLGIPEGIGISWFNSAHRLGRVKSGYAILDLPNCDVLRQRSQLSFVKRTLLGNLDVNRAAKEED